MDVARRSTSDSNPMGDAPRRGAPTKGAAHGSPGPPGRGRGADRAVARRPARSRRPRGGARPGRRGRAGRGAAAGRRARRAALDVLVTDLNMPRMGGEDLIRALRAERPGLPVVVVTGSAPSGGEEYLRRRAGGHGPLALLLKPVDCGELARALARAAASAGRRDGDGAGAPPAEADPYMALAG